MAGLCAGLRIRYERCHIVVSQIMNTKFESSACIAASPAASTQTKSIQRLLPFGLDIVNKSRLVHSKRCIYACVLVLDRPLQTSYLRLLLLTILSMCSMIRIFPERQCCPLASFSRPIETTRHNSSTIQRTRRHKESKIGIAKPHYLFFTISKLPNDHNGSAKWTN